MRLQMLHRIYGDETTLNTVHVAVLLVGFSSVKYCQIADICLALANFTLLEINSLPLYYYYSTVVASGGTVQLAV